MTLSEEQLTNFNTKMKAAIEAVNSGNLEELDSVLNEFSDPDYEKHIVTALTANPDTMQAILTNPDAGKCLGFINFLKNKKEDCLPGSIGEETLAYYAIDREPFDAELLVTILSCGEVEIPDNLIDCIVDLTSPLTEEESSLDKKISVFQMQEAIDRRPDLLQALNFNNEGEYDPQTRDVRLSTGNLGLALYLIYRQGWHKSDTTGRTYANQASKEAKSLLSNISDETIEMTDAVEQYVSIRSMYPTILETARRQADPDSEQVPNSIKASLYSRFGKKDVDEAIQKQEQENEAQAQAQAAADAEARAAAEAQQAQAAVEAETQVQIALTSSFTTVFSEMLDKRLEGYTAKAPAYRLSVKHLGELLGLLAAPELNITVIRAKLEEVNNLPKIDKGYKRLCNELLTTTLENMENISDEIRFRALRQAGSKFSKKLDEDHSRLKLNDLKSPTSVSWQKLTTNEDITKYRDRVKPLEDNEIEQFFDSQFDYFCEFGWSKLPTYQPRMQHFARLLRLASTGSCSVRQLRDHLAEANTLTGKDKTYQVLCVRMSNSLTEENLQEVIAKAKDLVDKVNASNEELANKKNGARTIRDILVAEPGLVAAAPVRDMPTDLGELKELGHGNPMMAFAIGQPVAVQFIEFCDRYDAFQLEQWAGMKVKIGTGLFASKLTPRECDAKHNKQQAYIDELLLPHLLFTSMFNHFAEWPQINPAELKHLCKLLELCYNGEPIQEHLQQAAADENYSDFYHSYCNEMAGTCDEEAWVPTIQKRGKEFVDYLAKMDTKGLDTAHGRAYKEIWQELPKEIQTKAGQNTSATTGKGQKPLPPRPGKRGGDNITDDYL